MGGDISLVSQQIFQRIQHAQRILIVSHHHPDGDTLGSASALATILENAGKYARVFCVDAVPSAFTYLPLQNLLHTLTPNEIQEYDLICILDMGDLKQTGIPELFVNLKSRIINIDHHATNEKYGDLNAVFFVSSTCELLYHLFMAANVPLTSDVATALLTGIMTDTDGFSNSATTKEVCRVSSQLLRLGARYKLIVKNVFKNKSVSSLHLWGNILSHVQVNTSIGCVCTLITLQDLDLYQVDDEACAGIANFLNSVTNAKMTLVLRELPGGKVKGSFRTTRDDVDVSKLAGLFGGGGHKKAAGFTISGKLIQENGQWKVM